MSNRFFISIALETLNICWFESDSVLYRFYSSLLIPGVLGRLESHERGDWRRGRSGGDEGLLWQVPPDSPVAVPGRDRVPAQGPLRPHRGGLQAHGHPLRRPGGSVRQPLPEEARRAQILHSR